jgi:hypothetical protein
MAFIALRKGAVDALTPRLKRMLRNLMDGVDLDGSPPVQLSPGGIPFYVFNDARIDVADAAFLAVSIGNLKALSAMVTEVPEGTPDPYAFVAQANGAPAALKMYAAPPTGWTTP